MSSVEVFADGSVREGHRTYPAKRPVYPCQSKKSAECLGDTRGLYRDGTFGYAGAVAIGVTQMVAICPSCFTSEHWEEQIAINNRVPDGFAIIEGKHYLVGDEKQRGHMSFRGFGGQRFTIRFDDGRPEVVTTNLVFHGHIPDEFRDRMPDNARFG